MMNKHMSLWKKLATLSLFLGVITLSSQIAGLAASPGQETVPVGTNITGDVTTDTTWGVAGSPYTIVPGEIRVRNGATLTIEPGVTVYIAYHGRIHVDSGSAIIAKGTPDQNIVFDRSAPTYTWKNIRHYVGSTSYYRYVQFLYGGNTEGSLYYEGGTHVLNNCQIKNNKRQGIVANGSDVNLRIAGTLFEGNKLHTIWIASGAKLTVTGSTFNDPDGDWSIFVRDYAPAPTISVSNSNFLRSLGIYNEQYAIYTVDAENNYWGPNHPSTKMGPGVDYNPWLGSQVDRVGITTPPTVTFTITPDPSVARPVGTEYTFDASDTTDAEDYLSSLDLCWDWEDDGGSCDTTAISATHSYASSGWHTARLTVTDTDGLTGTLTQQILSGWVPTATLNFTQTTWAQVEVDAVGSDDVEDAPEDLKAYWDWDGDGVWDTGAYSITTVVTHTYDHIGRYWLTLGVEDTDGVVGTQTRIVDIIPPAKGSDPVSGGGVTLVSTDGTVTVTVANGVISDGTVITHTPWITVPTGYGALPGDFTYQGFSLAAESGGLPIGSASGPFTITVEYDLDYYGGVLDIWASADVLKLYRWSDAEGAWVLVPSTINSGQLVATTDSFGDFALVSEPVKLYLPLVLRSY